MDFILKKSRFLDTYEQTLNEREMKVAKRMLKEGAGGVKGGMSARKYVKLTGTSTARATRDLQHLTAIKAFKQIGKGRNVHYDLNLELN